MVASFERFDDDAVPVSAKTQPRALSTFGRYLRVVAVSDRLWMGLRNAVNREVWLRDFQPGPAGRPQLICCPHAGGSASFFRPVAMALGPEIDVRCVQYPGRQDRRSEPCLESIELIADELFQTVYPIEAPFALFGHSMGATVAFELARRLERVGQRPAVLFVSGRRGPSVLKSETVHLRDDRGLIDEVRELSGTEQELLSDPDVLAMILPSLRSDYRAIETYRRTEGKPLSCPIVVLIGDADPRVSRSEALAWASETTGPFGVEVHPGGHFYLGPRAAQVNVQIRDYLRGFIAAADVSAVRSPEAMS